MKKQVVLRCCTLAGLMFSVMLVPFSCTKKNIEPDPEPEPFELKDQIEYNGGELVDIKSAVYEVDRNGVYTFYLSPTSGITDVEGMENADDYLYISVKSPDGTVDVSGDEFEVAYAELKVTHETMTDVSALILTADVVDETSVLNLYLELSMESGKTLLARYNNTVIHDAPAVLDNQLELDKEIRPIGSLLAWYSFQDKVTTYYFYEEQGVTAPSDANPAVMVITVADGYDVNSLNLPEADLDKITVSCGEFALDGMTEGTLSISEQALTGKLVVRIDAENESGYLRADYSGNFVSAYGSANTLKVTQDGTLSEAPLTKVFLYSKSGSNTFMLGSQDAQEPSGLMGGSYAMKFVVSEMNLGTQDFADGNIRFSLYGYEDYSTWDVEMASGKGATGTLTVVKDGDAYYLKVSVEFPDGTSAEAEWYGVPVAAEDTDIAPIEPFRPRIYITKPDGTVVVDRNLVSMEMRLEKGYELRGGPDYGGAVFDAYFFYFRPEGSTDAIESIYTIPQLRIPVSFAGSENLNLSEPQDGLYWSFKYQSSGLQAPEYSESYTMYGMSMGACPKESSLTVFQNEDKTWDISFSMLDKYSSYGMETGSGYKVLIEWKGPATKYSGALNNDMTDADY